MLQNLVKFALTQRLVTLAITLALIVAGAVSFSRLPIDAFPDISTTQVKVIMKAPGMTPEEVEQRSILTRAQTSTGRASKSQNA